MNSIHIENLSVTCHGKPILKEIRAHIPKGKILAVVGPNGSGKSTLLKALLRLLQPGDSITGNILIEEREISSFSPKELSRKIAYFSQRTIQARDYTVEELVSFGRMPYESLLPGRRGRDTYAVEQAMKRCHVYDLKKLPFYRLSGGEQQRVRVAMCLAQEADILLLDEPTTYMDLYHQLEFLHLIREIHKAERNTVVLVLHNLNHALQFADEAIVLHQGRVAAQGECGKVLVPDLIEKVFGIRTQPAYLGEQVQYLPYLSALPSSRG